MHFLPHPQHEKIQIQTKRGRRTSKLPKICTFFPRILHLSSNRRERNLALYFQFTTPARKLTHTTKFKHFWIQKDMNFGNARILRHFVPEKCQKSTPERHEFWEHHNSSALGPEKCQNQPQKYTNFGNAIILRYLGPENHQIQPRKTRILHRTALIDPSKNANKISKVFVFFQNFTHCLKCTH